MRRRDALIAIGALAVTGASGRARAWPVRTGRFAELQHGIDPAHPEPSEHGGGARDGALRGELPSHEPRILWQRASDPGGRTRPRDVIVAADGTIVVPTQRGVAAFGIGGEPRFEANIGPMDGAPALLPGDGIVAISRSGRVVVLSRDGEARAEVELGVGVSASPLVLDDGSIVLAAADRTLRRLDASLVERWRAPLPGGAAHAPTLDGDRVAVISGDQLSFVTFDGSVERSIALGGRAHGSASRAPDGTLWVPLVEGELLAIEGRRRVRARVLLGARLGSYERIAIAPDGSLRVPARREGLFSFAASGERRWAIPSEHAVDFPARVDRRGWTLVADRAPRLSVFDEVGTMVWRARLPVHVWSGAVLASEGRIVAVGMRGEVLVLG